MKPIVAASSIRVTDLRRRGENIAAAGQPVGTALQKGNAR